MKDIIKVLVVDDHPIVRRGLSTEINLDRGMQVVGEAADGADAVRQFTLLRPDVVLMDIVLPGVDGVQATREIILLDPRARILMITSYTDEKTILEALKAGALGFIYKDRHPDEVLAAIRDVAADVPVLAPGITRQLLRAAQANASHEHTGELTMRELEILRQVALGKPYKQIAFETHIQEATVRAHVSNILGKLGLSNRSQLVLYAVEHRL